VGSEEILSAPEPTSIQNLVMDALKRKFKPEFLNRIDEFVTFNRLDYQQLSRIVGLEIEKVKSRLADRDISIDVTEEAKEWLAVRGFDPTYGARPLKRTIQRDVETPLSKLLLGGEIQNGSVVMIDAGLGDENMRITIREAGQDREQAQA